MYRFLSLVFVTAVAFLHGVGAQAETLDPTFSGDGRYIYGETGSLQFRAVATLPLPSGKVVSVFQFPPFTGFCSVPKCLSLALFDASGTLNRVVTHDNNLEEVVAAAVDHSGRIVVVGRTNPGANGRDIHVARFVESDLARDTGFAGGVGWVNLSFNSQDEYPAAVAIDRSDRIIVAGSFTFTATDTDFGIAVLRSNGTLDTGFNGTGMRAIPFDLASGLKLDGAQAVSVADNGDIIAVGNAYDAGISRIRVAVTRLTPNGAFQTSFCPTGCNYNAGYSAIREGRTIYQFAVVTNHSDDAQAVDAYSGGYVMAGATYADNGGNRRAVLATFDDSGNLVNERIAASLGDNGIFHSVKAIGSPSNRMFVAAGESGPGDNFLMLQAFTSVLGYRIGHGDCQPNGNGFCLTFSNTLADHGPDVGRFVSIDPRGRVLLSAQGIAVDGGHAAVMTARFTNNSGPLPELIFRNGFN